MAATDGDVIEVRPDERIDAARVADFLRDRVEGGDLPLAVRQFGGGHANLTYLLRYASPDGARAFEYVLRRPPLGPVAKGAHDMHREYRALSVLWQAFPYAPRALVYSDDVSIVGAEFLVMERRDGVVVRGAVPAVFGGGRDPVANRKLSLVVVDTLAELHGVDAAALGLDALGRPDGFLERQVRGWAERYERAKTSDDPTPGEVARWLADHRPASPPPALLHNDWKLDNMAVAPDDPGRCVAVYDWDMCTIGDPLCDLGTTLCSWRAKGDASEGNPGAMPVGEGFLTDDEGAARYCERTGTDPAVVPYYQVFGIFKMGVVIQQIYFRYAQGQTQDARFARMDALAHALFARA
ncbi:MAG: phosphotransferase family protein, partial [Myxococcales bacterium]|nr:phosphotransferase family protein [Myxococcales bacterium]